MKTQFPYHPTTGQRLVQTINTAVFFNTARIVKVDGSDSVEVIDALGVEAANVEQAHIDRSPFVATGTGSTCLLSEAVWSDLDVERLEGFKDKTSGTPLPSLNSALADLVQLGEAAQIVLSNWDKGDLAGAVHELEDSVLAIPLLSNRIDDEAEA